MTVPDVPSTDGVRDAKAGPVGNLATWLREQIDEDERAALREINAKREIIAWHDETELESEPDHDPMGEGCATCGHFDWPCEPLRLLALPYATRPGYREEWRPEERQS